ncbi:hypothetical protein bcere0016_11970 [Bacillus cereus 95/8201]|nr:hypothetical protein bcere0016_11970 [Bacillus cereus 95/8201]
MFTVLIEAKNYNVMISSGRRSLINIVVKQFEDRLKHLPEGSHQTVVIDVRGPDETGEILKQIREEINQRTFGQVQQVKISIKCLMKLNQRFLKLIIYWIKFQKNSNILLRNSAKQTKWIIC